MISNSSLLGSTEEVIVSFKDSLKKERKRVLELLEAIIPAEAVTEIDKMLRAPIDYVFFRYDNARDMRQARTAVLDIVHDAMLASFDLMLDYALKNVSKKETGD